MAKCSRCGNEGVNVGVGQMTNWDRVTLQHGTRGGHPPALVLTGTSVAAKYAFSPVYRCRGCNHMWREWLE